jgi:hypothetical protein
LERFAFFAAVFFLPFFAALRFLAAIVLLPCEG